MFDLTSSQQIVWLHEQMQPQSMAYNFTAFADLRGTLNAQALRDSLAAVLDRHAGLRLQLVDVPGALPRQRVSEGCALRWRDIDLSAEPDPEAAFHELLRSEATEPLDVYRAPLLRFTLVRLGARRHRLIHVEHHLVHDGRSFSIVLEDLFSGYAARTRGEPPVRPAARSFTEYADSGAASAAAPADDLAYWRQTLRGADFSLPLPGMSLPGTTRRRAGRQLRQSLDPELTARIGATSRTYGHTTFSTLLGMFTELMRRHSGRSDLVVGTAVGNRPEGFEQTVGMFVNTVPLRLRLDPAAEARTAVEEVTEALFRSLPHQHVPVQELTRELGLHSDGVANPLFNVMFSAHDAPLPELEVPGLEVTLHEGHNVGTSRFDLDLVLLPDDRRTIGPRSGGAGMTLVWDYDTDVFTTEAARLLADRYLALVRAYAAGPGGALAALASPAAVPVPSGTGTPPVGGRPASADDSSWLDPVAGKDPALPALISASGRLSYGELDRRVDTLAERLGRAGVSAGRPVAVLLPRGDDNVVALLACLRVGAVYCPLSPTDPAERLAALLRGLDPALVLTTRAGALALPAGSPPAAQFDGPDFPAAAGSRYLPDTAYVIHTSGSTGTPKPVALSRAALANHVRGIAERYGLTPQDRVLLFAQPSFDVALEEVLPSLAGGSCLVLPRNDVPTGEELAVLLSARGVSVVNLPTSYFLACRRELGTVLQDGRWRPRLIVVGGERLPTGLLRDLLHSTEASVLNAYGVTEAAITSTVHEVTREETARDSDVPLGAELPGVRVHVLDAGHHPLPSGAVGELAIAGDGLAHGYPGADELTAARFVRVPALGDERVYLTGDLGYRDAGGRLCFLGRRDNQVKLRGYRIELEEVEAAASKALGGLPCAVVRDGAPAGGPRLVGFLEAASPPDGAAVHTALTEMLPAALIPDLWVALDTLPLLPGGKPDRRTLTRLASVAAPEIREAPRTANGSDPAVDLLSEGWREVLGHGRFSPDSHFFQVGGHSLLAAQLAAWLEPRLGHKPPLRVLLRHPVLSDQAHALARVAT